MNGNGNVEGMANKKWLDPQPCP